MKNTPKPTKNGQAKVLATYMKNVHHFVKKKKRKETKEKKKLGKEREAPFLSPRAA